MGRSKWSLRARLAPGALLIALALAAGGCGSAAEKTLYIGGIPDQDVSVLETRFRTLAEYLSDELGVRVEYVPSVDYAAVVTAFRNGDMHLAWFGGLTGVQARLAAPGARAVAQRPRDAEFHSVFIARRDLGVRSLQDLKGLTFTFGSESSTSGYLMPLYYLGEAGIDPDRDFRAVSFSGSHDRTWKLVESGAFQAGALNAAVWEKRVASGDVDVGKVQAFWKTPAYFDYHWVVRGDLDETFGPGTTRGLTDALLALDAGRGGRDQTIMDAFQSSRFVATTNENYSAIESVARSLGVIQ